MAHFSGFTHLDEQSVRHRQATKNRRHLKPNHHPTSTPRSNHRFHQSIWIRIQRQFRNLCLPSGPRHQVLEEFHRTATPTVCHRRPNRCYIQNVQKTWNRHRRTHRPNHLSLAQGQPKKRSTRKTNCGQTRQHPIPVRRRNSIQLPHQREITSPNQQQTLWHQGSQSRKYLLGPTTHHSLPQNIR